MPAMARLDLDWLDKRLARQGYERNVVLRASTVLAVACAVWLRRTMAGLFGARD